MRFKKIMILTIIFVSLLAVSTVSAAENTMVDIVSVENDNHAVVEATEDEEVLSVENTNQTINLVDGEDDFLNANSEGTFTDLANEIANANGILNLTKNYGYDPSKDSEYINGIEITKPITINGKGFVINGVDSVRAFYISSDNVILKNIEFFNGYSSSGGAVYWNGATGSLFDCSFTNCHSSSGGAVYWNGATGSLFDCSFTNCYSSTYGGAVYWDGAAGSLFDCSFTNCYIYSSNSNSEFLYRPSAGSSAVSSGYGGVIYWKNTGGNLFNCDFIDCYCEAYNSASASAISRDYSKDPFKGTSASTSSSSSSSTYGGVIYWISENGCISNCNFIDCYSYSYSHSFSSSKFTHYVEIGNTYGTHDYYCDSTSSSSSYSYGSIYFSHGANLINCSFINSTSSFTSGSSSDKDSASYVKSSCTSSSSTFGGAIYWGVISGTISDCNFIKSSSTSLSHKDTVYWKDIGYQFNCSFNGNYYDYNEYCGNSASVYPIILIHNPTLNDDARILIFESTPLVNNITVTIYNVTDRKVLYDEFNISSQDLTSSLNLNNLEEGEYQIVLDYGGDEFYSATSVNDLFKIGKNSSYDVAINEIIIAGDNPTINLTLNNDATGKVKFTSSDYSCVEELVDGKVTFNIPNVSSGINTYNIKYEGDEKYNPIYIVDTFKVLLKSDISLNLTENNVFGEKIALTYNIKSNCTGIISLFVDNVFKANITIGELFELEDIPAGEHNISVIYNGDEYYFTSSHSTIISVSKADPSIKVNSSNIPGPVSFDVILNEKATGNVNVTINNNSYSKNLIEGKANIIIPYLNAGTYSARVYYNGDNNYNARIYDTELTINKISTTVVGTAEDITYSQNAIINVKGSVEGVVVVKVGENYINNISVMANTVTPISFENIPYGKHDVTITLKPTNNNYAESTYNTEFTVSKKQTSVMANVEDITYSEKAIINVKASVDGIAVVKIDETYINNVNVIANTIAPVCFENIPAGKHDVAITLKPTNMNYDESTYNTEFSVSLKETSIRLNVVDSVYGKDVIVNVTASEDGKLILKIGDITKEKNVFANTQTKFNLGVLAANSYDVEVSFDAGENYRQSNQQSSFTISPAKSEIVTIQTQDNIYGENTIIKVKTNVTGVLSVKLNNGNTKTFNIDANKLTALDLGKYDVDNYNIDLTLDAGLNYIKSTGNAKVTVNPKQTTVKVNADNSVYGNKVIVKVTASENGKVTVNVGNNVRTVDVEANKVASVDFGILNANSYEINATFDGGKNYQTSFDKTSFVVSPKVPILTLVDFVNNYVYTQNVIIKMKSDTDGTLTVKVGDTPQTKQVIAGNTVSFDFGILNVSSYGVTINFDVGNNYVPYQNTTSITVTPKSTTLTRVDPVSSYTYLENVIIKVKTDTEGILTVKVGDTPQSKQVTAGNIVSFNFGVLNVSNYDVTISLDVGNNYIPYQNTTSIVITPKSTSLTLNVKDYDTPEKVIVNVTASENGKVTIRLGSITKTIDVNANTLTAIDFGVLDIGSYNISANFTAGNNYINSTATGNVKVLSKIKDEDINIEIPETISDKDSDIVIKLPADATGIVTLTIGNNSYPFTVKDGVADIEVPKLDDGKYDYEITYSGDSKYSSFTKSANMTVNNIIPTEITSSGFNTVYNSGECIVATLKDKDGNPMKYVKVTVTFSNGNTDTQTTNKYGQVQFSTNGLAPVNKYSAKITFDGNAKYGQSTYKVKVKVYKATPKITAKAQKFKRSDKKKLYTIRLLTNQNIKMKYTKVYIKVNGKLYSAQTNKKGYATFKLTKLTNKGKYKAKIMYGGNSYYNALAIKVKLTVK